VKDCSVREVKAAHRGTKKAAIAGHVSCSKSLDAIALTIALTGLVNEAENSTSILLNTLPKGKAAHLYRQPSGSVLRMKVRLSISDLLRQS